MRIILFLFNYFFLTQYIFILWIKFICFFLYKIFCFYLLYLLAVLVYSFIFKYNMIIFRIAIYFRANVNENFKPLIYKIEDTTNERLRKMDVYSRFIFLHNDRWFIFFFSLHSFCFFVVKTIVNLLRVSQMGPRQF